jgi:hypothetical protein
VEVPTQAAEPQQSQQPEPSAVAPEEPATGFFGVAGSAFDFLGGVSAAPEEEAPKPEGPQESAQTAAKAGGDGYEPPDIFASMNQVTAPTTLPEPTKPEPIDQQTAFPSLGGSLFGGLMLNQPPPATQGTNPTTEPVSAQPPLVFGAGDISMSSIHNMSKTSIDDVVDNQVAFNQTAPEVPAQPAGGSGFFFMQGMTPVQPQIQKGA